MAPPFKPQSIYNRVVADRICARLSNGEALRTICRDDDMPGFQAVFGWLAKDVDGFVERYTAAQNCRIEFLVDEALEIADETDADIVIGPLGGRKVDREAIQRSDLRVKTRLWLAEKLIKAKYGNHQTIEASKATLEALVLASFKPKEPAEG